MKNDDTLSRPYCNAPGASLLLYKDMVLKTLIGFATKQQHFRRLRHSMGRNWHAEALDSRQFARGARTDDALRCGRILDDVSAERQRSRAELR